MAEKNIIPQRIEITARTIVFTVFFLLFLKFLWIVKELLFSLFIAFILVSALKPPVHFLEKKGVPRLFATILIYLLFLFLISNIFVLIIPSLVTEITNFFRSFPNMLRNVAYILPPFVNNLDFIGQYVPNAANQFLDIIQGVFSNTIFVISTLFFGFYLLLEENAIGKILLKFFDEKEIKSVLNIVDKAEKRMNAWFWGEIMLMTVIGVLTFIGLNLIGVRYALALSVLAGVLEVIPNIGPIISLIPAFIIGVSESYFLGFATIAVYFIVQQLENHLIVPFVMKRALGLSPLITLMALIIGGKLAGVVGLILAVPTALFIEVILIELIKEKKSAA